MNRAKKFIGVLSFILFSLSAGAPYSFAQQGLSNFGPNWALVVLAPGLTRTIKFPIYDLIWNDVTAYHATFIFTFGEGTLSLSATASSALGPGAEIIFSTLGFVGTESIIESNYGSGGTVRTLELTGFNFGILLTYIAAAFNNPNFPVIMKMTLAMQQ
jgi:hypothetical protein